jgi:DHA2 family multidrug resistance protein
LSQAVAENDQKSGARAQASGGGQNSQAAEDHSNWKPRVNPWLIAATVALAAFMEVLDTSIANVALPHIAGDLGASTDESTWVLTSYLVANAVVLPLGGWASSVIGRKNFFMLCITIFTVSSFLCGIAWTLPLLLLFRVFQGAGGGGLQPMAQAIMADSFDPKQRGLAFSLYGLVAVLAPSIGPTIGGWITDNYSWHWIFYINIPVGILAFVLTNRLVEDPPYAKHDRANLFRLDFIGLGFLSLAMAALQIGLDKGEELDWFSNHWITLCAVVFGVSMILLAWWELRADDPIMNLRLFKFKNFAVCCALMLLIGGVLNASTVLQPQFLQGQLGYTATMAGISLSLGGIALIFVMPMAGILVSKFPARNLIAMGFAMFAVFYYYVAYHLNTQISLGNAAFLRVVQVIPIPFLFISVTTAAYFGLPREASNQVAGLINFMRNVGGSILISLTNAEVTRRTLYHESVLQSGMSPVNPNYLSQVRNLTSYLGRSLGPGAGPGAAVGRIYEMLGSQAATQAYIDVFWLISVATACMFPLAFMLDKNDPSKTEMKHE